MACYAGKVRISKAEYFAKGAWRNSKLCRVATKSGAWRYYLITD